MFPSKVFSSSSVIPQLFFTDFQHPVFHKLGRKAHFASTELHLKTITMSRRQHGRFTFSKLLMFIAALTTPESLEAFQYLTSANVLPLHRKLCSQPRSFFDLSLSAKNSPGDDDHVFDLNDASVLRKRLHSLHLHILEEELSRPPNAKLNPIQTVEAILHGLLNSYDPLPESGFRLLLNNSSPKWRKEILKSLGVVSNKNNFVDYDLVASALESSMGRPHNQFAILVGEGEEYVLDFSASESQLLDFGDGTCWVECRLRDKTTGKLLVLTGWDLCKRDDDGAWFVDWIYWQDFREAFRPGIGREEWLVEV